MTKRILLARQTILFLMILFLTGSCNNDNSTDKNAAANPATGDTAKTTTAITAPPAALLGGTLDSLWVDSLAFTKLGNEQTVFSFYIGGLDTLTLHGWAGKGSCKTTYTTDPDIRLYKGRPSNVSYGPGTYLGNVILDKNSVKNISKVLKDSAAQFVLFAPQRAGAFINYKIYLSKENPAILVKTRAIIDPNAMTNPSPPKN